MSVKNAAYLVSDDADFCKSLTSSFKAAGLSLTCFATVEDYVSGWDDTKPHGCVIADVKSNGLELVRELSALKVVMPVIVMVPHGAVSAAIHAIKSGAIDAVEKPIKGDALIESARKAIALFVKLQKIIEEREIATERIESLTPRETQVIDLMAQGKSNREIAEELGISPKTLDIHRCNVKDKMEAHTVGGICRAHLLNRTETAYLHLLL